MQCGQLKLELDLRTKVNPYTVRDCDGYNKKNVKK